MKTKNLTVNRATVLWTLLGALLILGGFLVDGSTEIGHHLFLIAGGMAVGAGFKNTRKE